MNTPQFGYGTPRQKAAKNRSLTDYVTRNDKVDLLLDGDVIDHCYPSLLSHVFENLAAPWPEGDTKHFSGGSISYQEFLNIFANEHQLGFKPRSVIILRDNNGEAYRSASLLIT